MYVCTCTSACRLYLSVLQCVHVHVHIPQTFINYLQGVGDPGTRLLFKFRSGTNGLNEELGRHLGIKMMIGSVSYVGMNVRILM